mgnify:CR=1 FL=1
MVRCGVECAKSRARETLTRSVVTAVSNRERLGAREGLIAKLIELVSQQDLTDENGTSMRQHSACTIGNLAFGCGTSRNGERLECFCETHTSGDGSPIWDSGQPRADH